MTKLTISNGNVLMLPETAHPKTSLGGCGHSPASECTMGGVCVEAQDLAVGTYLASQGGATVDLVEVV